MRNSNKVEVMPNGDERNLWIDMKKIVKGKCQECGEINELDGNIFWYCTKCKAEHMNLGGDSPATIVGYKDNNGKKTKKECKHENKAYSNQSMVLTCIPPITVSYWICKDCGFKSEDRTQADADTYFEYENTVAKFDKTKTSNITNSTSGKTTMRFGYNIVGNSNDK